MPSLMRYINIVSRCGAIWRADHLKGSELGDQHHSYILTVCRHPGISQDGLASRLFINKSTVTRSLTYLEEHGYVRREHSAEDKRCVLVYPTEKALEALPEVRQIVHGWNKYVTDGFSEEELEMFHSMMERLAARAAEYAHLSGEAVSDSPPVPRRKKGEGDS